MIEWNGMLINPSEVLSLSFGHTYADVYDCAYGGGYYAANIWFKNKERPIEICCNEKQYSELKQKLTQTPEERR